MVRQSISITTPNDNWLNSLVESEEYSSKSEVVNDLIRKARERQTQIEKVRAMLIEGENSGFVNFDPIEIRKKALEELKRNGEL